jgi:hypothetical protein
LGGLVENAAPWRCARGRWRSSRLTVVRTVPGRVEGESPSSRWRSPHSRVVRTVPGRVAIRRSRDKEGGATPRDGQDSATDTVFPSDVPTGPAPRLRFPLDVWRFPFDVSPSVSRLAIRAARGPQRPTFPLRASLFALPSSRFPLRALRYAGQVALRGTSCAMRDKTSDLPSSPRLRRTR